MSMAYEALNSLVSIRDRRQEFLTDLIRKNSLLS